MSVDIPLRTVNEDQSPAIRRGAFFLQLQRTLKVMALTADIPKQLDIDLANTKSKDVIRLQNIAVPPGMVPLVKDEMFTIGTVVGKKLDEASA